MNYEQKYKDALNRAKSVYGENPVDSERSKACQIIFPELRKIEDERIINSLLFLCDEWEHHPACRTTPIEEHAKEIKIWLEKQKKFLHISETCKENADPEEDKFQEAMRMADKFEEGYEAGVYDTKAKAWKPSEEQMEALEYIICNIPTPSEKAGRGLNSLREELSRLV